MAKELAFPLESKPLLEEVVRVQRALNQATEAEDSVLARLHQYDLSHLLERLEITPCSICYHGDGTNTAKCDLWNKCESYIKVEDTVEQEQAANLRLSLVFQVN